MGKWQYESQPWVASIASKSWKPQKSHRVEKLLSRNPSMKQLSEVEQVAIRNLAMGGINSIEALETTEPHRIETLSSRTLLILFSIIIPFFFLVKTTEGTPVNKPPTPPPKIYIYIYIYEDINIPQKRPKPHHPYLTSETTDPNPSKKRNRGQTSMSNNPYISTAEIS